MCSLRPPGFTQGVTRRYLGGIDPSGDSDQPYLPDQIISLEQALAAYTIEGAYVASEEKERGSIEAGKLADLAVLEKNLFEVPPLEIHKVRVDLTVFDGRIIFDRRADK